MDTVTVADERTESVGDRALVVETRGLAKRFGDVEAVRSVDLAVPAHSIFGFLGPNGAGKTTTLRMLVGLLTPSAGTGRVLGADLAGDGLALRRRIGYLPQQPRFYPDLTARETLQFTAGFFFRPGPGVDRRIDDLVELVGLQDRAERPVGAFSGGERQRLGLAQAQLHGPELLILDEPAAGLDPLGRRDVLDLMERLRDRTTVLYSTHILDDVQRVSDTVAIVSHGTMVAQAPIDQLLAGTEGAVYRLSTRGPTAAIRDRLARLSWVRDVQVHGDPHAADWAVAVDDETAADHHLLRIVLEDPALSVTDFGRRTFELEDVFLRIVEEATS
ncbi:ABC transporter ATP-binding protein [Salsipaludibacter albus]|uniref:ABC transporter ATP-binding protein n=1 Tax=Salsipaludibacter albus TaxID=2849650 RepID=UPI001EE44201|nr:ABC transporter ATP-binding protein [Salsipaludibacter albus]MBY5162044.1 ABC transporter ATP-binding protein [Salsipaludibacter albus]